MAIQFEEGNFVNYGEDGASMTWYADGSISATEADGRVLTFDNIVDFFNYCKQLEQREPVVEVREVERQVANSGISRQAVMQARELLSNALIDAEDENEDDDHDAQNGGDEFVDDPFPRDEELGDYALPPELEDAIQVLDMVQAEENAKSELEYDDERVARYTKHVRQLRASS